MGKYSFETLGSQRGSPLKVALSLWALLSGLASGLDIDPNSYDSVHAACALVATGLMDYYWGYDYGGTVGMFTHPYYWWQAGGAWGSMIDYSFFFQNHTYDDIIITSLLYQAGPDYNFMPLNQTVTEGNDDQVFWGIAAIQAAERNFTNPPASKPSWLNLAEACFNTMKNRWDSSSCNGGLRWQIFEWNSGYDYKNTVSNAGLFHLGARLLRYTGNDSYYMSWCEETYNWLIGVQFVTEDPYHVFDGANIEDNCTSITPYQWTYNSALMLSGCAYMYNYTGEEIWKTRVNGFLTQIDSIFFDNHGNMYESACQGLGTCKTDQRAFRAYLARFMSLTSILVPETYDNIHGHFVNTTLGLSESCSGGFDGHTCGQNWSYGSWDNMYGLGEQMSALEVLQNLVAADRPAPYTGSNGGSSQGDPIFGNSTDTTSNAEPLDLDGGDKAGAAIITIIVGFSIFALGGYLLWP